MFRATASVRRVVPFGVGVTGWGCANVEKRERIPEFVEGLAKGLAVIEAFDETDDEMTLSDVARKVGSSPSSARRSLMTLMELGYVGLRGRSYFLKPKVLRLASVGYFTHKIERFVQPELHRIVDRFGDASSVATLDGHDVVYLAHVSVQRARRVTAMVGARYPAHATSLGRAMLATLPDAALDAWFETLQPRALTGQTVVDKRALRGLVLQARDDGYATTVDQLDYGVTALAVPIRCAEAGVVAAVNSSGYTGMVTPEQLVGERLEALRDVAQTIATAVAHHPALAATLTA